MLFYQVRGCGKLFVEEQQLDVHFKHHEHYTPRKGKHRCHICGEAFYQKDMLKRHVLSLHEQVTSFRGRNRVLKRANNAGAAGKSGDPTGNLSGGRRYRKLEEGPVVPLKYDPNMTLAPGTLMTVFKCPVETCGKNSCTDIKSFKLHAMHVHQKSLEPIIEEAEAK